MLTGAQQILSSDAQELTLSEGRASPSPIPQSPSPSSTYALLTTMMRSTSDVVISMSPTPYPNVPHQRGDMFTGLLPQLRKDLIKTLIEVGALAEENDKRMASFYVGSNKVLLLTDPGLVTTFKSQLYPVFLTHNNPAWERFPGTAMLHQEATNKKVRGLYAHQFAGNNFKVLKAGIAQTSDEYIERLTTIQDNHIVNASQYFRRFALELASRFLMGIDDISAVNGEGFLSFIADLLKGYGPDSGLHLLGLLEQDPKATESDVFKEKMVKRLSALLEPIKENILANDSIFKSLWSLSDAQDNSSKNTIENLFADAVFFLIGGPVVSVADSFTIILQLLAANPGVENKLIEELLALNVGDSAEINIDELTYLDKIIKEAFRLHPPFPIIPVRTANADFEIESAKVSVKKGDRILISPYVLHHSAKNWSYPEQFIPERFDKLPSSGTFLPFGSGSNYCVGQFYAMAVLKTMLAKMYSTFELKISYENDLQLSGPSMVNDGMAITVQPRQQIRPELNTEAVKRPSL